MGYIGSIAELNTRCEYVTLTTEAELKGGPLSKVLEQSMCLAKNRERILQLAWDYMRRNELRQDLYRKGV
jgi:hypothetical protein